MTSVINKNAPGDGNKFLTQLMLLSMTRNGMIRQKFKNPMPFLQCRVHLTGLTVNQGCRQVSTVRKYVPVIMQYTLISSNFSMPPSLDKFAE